MLPKDIKKLIELNAYAASIAYGQQEKQRLIVELERLQSNELLAPELKKFIKKLRVR